MATLCFRAARRLEALLQGLFQSLEARRKFAAAPWLLPVALPCILEMPVTYRSFLEPQELAGNLATCPWLRSPRKAHRLARFASPPAILPQPKQNQALSRSEAAMR